MPSFFYVQIWGNIRESNFCRDLAMRIIKRVFFTIVLLLILLAGIGMLLPREVEVARSIEINASAEEIFPLVNIPKNTELWSPWLSIDPNVKVSYGEIVAGKGATMEWRSEHPNVGNGTVEIIESVENSKVVTALDFGPQGKATAIMLLEQTGDRTKATWNLVADMGAGPVGRWFGLMMDNMIGADYEKGLEKLKKHVESK